jgi:hypothetical protein
MAQRRHHYEAAFEVYLRSRRIPYVAVDEAKKALLPARMPTPITPLEPVVPRVSDAIKSFDFVLYGQMGNLLAEVKGRRASASGRLERWVTGDDVASLCAWETLFGPAFEAAFIFIYVHQSQPRDALFEELFDHAGLWYALRVVNVRRYARLMHCRSRRWNTFDLPAKVFEQVSEPFTPGLLQRLGGRGDDDARDRCGDRPPVFMPHSSHP